MHGEVDLPKRNEAKFAAWDDLHTRLLLEVPQRMDNAKVELAPLPRWLGGGRTLR